MILERFPELLKLSELERLQLLTELRETILSDESVVDPAIVAELERRMEEYRRNPNTARPWAEVRKELRERYS
jgi:putative addiction module component (TIGR02574 family)